MTDSLLLFNFLINIVIHNKNLVKCIYILWVSPLSHIKKTNKHLVTQLSTKTKTLKTTITHIKNISCNRYFHLKCPEPVFTATITTLINNSVSCSPITRHALLLKHGCYYVQPFTMLGAVHVIPLLLLSIVS